MANPSSAYSSLSLYDTTSLPYLNIQGPAGSLYRFAWLAPMLQQMDLSAEVQMHQFDFYGQPGATMDVFNNLAGQINDQAGYTGETVVGYIVFEGDGGGQQSQDQFCIPGTNICVPNPFTPGYYSATSVYRLIVLTIPAGQTAPGGNLAVRALAFLPLAGVALLVIVSVISIIFLVGYVTGKIRLGDIAVFFRQLGDAAKNLPIPGNPVGAVGAATLPILALGLGIAAAAIFLPRLGANFGGGYGVGGGNVNAGVSLGGGGGGNDGGGGRRRR